MDVAPWSTPEIWGLRILLKDLKVSYQVEIELRSQEMSLFKLMSNDGVTFSVDSNIVNQLTTIKTMVDDLGEGDNEGEIIPLPNVRAVILEKIIQWAAYHKNDDPPSSEDDDKTDDISVWDSEFLNIDQETLFELILAANYLDIRPLLKTTCKTVANMIKGKTPEQIQATFNINPNLD